MFNAKAGQSKLKFKRNNISGRAFFVKMCNTHEKLDYNCLLSCDRKAKKSVCEISQTNCSSAYQFAESKGVALNGTVKFVRRAYVWKT